MKIVIAGCESLGRSLAEEFSSQGHDVVIIDNVEENFARLGSDFYGRIIKCVEIDSCTLVKADMAHADMFLAVTPDDNINIITSQIAKNIHGVKTVIAGNVDPSREFIYSKLGIEYVGAIKLAVNAIKNKVSYEGEK
jgi:trk system potassium uptake protein